MRVEGSVAHGGRIEVALRYNNESCPKRVVVSVESFEDKLDANQFYLVGHIIFC